MYNFSKLNFLNKILISHFSNLNCFDEIFFHLRKINFKILLFLQNSFFLN